MPSIVEKLYAVRGQLEEMSNDEGEGSELAKHLQIVALEIGNWILECEIERRRADVNCKVCGTGKWNSWKHEDDCPWQPTI